MAVIAECLAELKSQQAQEPVGHVYRYGKDSHGREWHGIHWYDPNLDVPTGTKLYTAPQSAEVELDAARYRWLRANLNNPDALAELYKHGGYAPSPEEFDAAIDAALGKKP